MSFIPTPLGDCSFHSIQPDLFRLPDGVTPVHLARNQALSNVCVPTTIMSLTQAQDSRVLGGVTSLAAAVGGSSYTIHTLTLSHTLFSKLMNPFLYFVIHLLTPC